MSFQDTTSIWTLSALMQTVVLFIGNDPSAGSPTETLWRRLLPVDQGSQHVDRDLPVDRGVVSVNRMTLKRLTRPLTCSL